MRFPDSIYLNIFIHFKYFTFYSHVQNIPRIRVIQYFIIANSIYECIRCTAFGLIYE